MEDLTPTKDESAREIAGVPVEMNHLERARKGASHLARAFQKEGGGGVAIFAKPGVEDVEVVTVFAVSGVKDTKEAIARELEKLLAQVRAS